MYFFFFYFSRKRKGRKTYIREYANAKKGKEGGCQILLYTREIPPGDFEEYEEFRGFK